MWTMYLCNFKGYVCWKKSSEMLPLILVHFKIIIIVYFLFSNLNLKTWLFKPWLLNPAMTNWTECFLQAHHYIFGCNSGTNIKALFFMKILCIFIQTRFWHNLIECLFWSQYQTHSTVTTTYINRKCTLWIIVFVSNSIECLKS